MSVSEGEARYHETRARIEEGHVKYREKLRAEGKLFVRDRLKLLPTIRPLQAFVLESLS